MSILFLKIKLKALHAESKIIRLHERRLRGGDPLRDSLACHRRGTVRRAARETHLAYGFLRNRSLSSIERTSHRSPDWKAVEKMVTRYGPPGASKGLKEWAGIAQADQPVLSSLPNGTRSALTR